MNQDIESRLAALGVRSSDVEERFVLGSGRGGQKIQKTSSCVWLRHQLTGMEVRCQRERSQAANRDHAWAELCRKLEEKKREAEAVRIADTEKKRRSNRPRSYRQKIRLKEVKKHRAKTKSGRGRIE